MDTELRCLTCDTILPANRTKFCCRQHAMKWHNSRAPWQERKDRHRKNAVKKAAYRADPEFWRNKARKWRENNPEANRLIEERAQVRYWNSPWIKLVNAARYRSKVKKISFDLTNEWGAIRWTGFCEITGLPFAPRGGGPTSAFSPSIDRIIPANGYTEKNSRFVLYAVNALKGEATDEIMFFIASKIISKLIPQQPVPPKT